MVNLGQKGSFFALSPNIRPFNSPRPKPRKDMPRRVGPRPNKL